jgi:hypothetical protein
MELLDVNKLVPYVNNARTHSAAQILKIRASLREFGFVNPVLVDNDLNVIAGHGRIIAAKDEGIEQIPCVFVENLSKAQTKAYILADNRLALDAGWDDELLKIELESLTEIGFDISLAGFDKVDLDTMFPDPDGDDDELYTDKVTIPQYEITGACPDLSDCLDHQKYDALLEDIYNADLDEHEKAFLRFAAARHLVFDYSSIAEYYAHSDPELQRLMEESALVIIDFDDAIANGYVSLSGDIKEMFEEDDGDNNAE